MTRSWGRGKNWWSFYRLENDTRNLNFSIQYYSIPSIDTRIIRCLEIRIFLELNFLKRTTIGKTYEIFLYCNIVAIPWCKIIWKLVRFSWIEFSEMRTKLEEWNSIIRNSFGLCQEDRKNEIEIKYFYAILLDSLVQDNWKSKFVSFSWVEFFERISD